MNLDSDNDTHYCACRLDMDDGATIRTRVRTAVVCMSDDVHPDEGDLLRSLSLEEGQGLEEGQAQAGKAKEMPALDRREKERPPRES